MKYVKKGQVVGVEKGDVLSVQNLVAPNLWRSSLTRAD